MLSYAMSYKPAYIKGRRLRRKLISPTIKGYDAKNLSKAEKIQLIALLTIQFVLIAYILLSILDVSLYLASSTDLNVGSSIMDDLLSTGAFDANNGVNDSATKFFLKVCNTVFSVALPFMSIFAIFMTTISFVASIIYLTKPDTFDEIHELHEQRKGSTKNIGVQWAKANYEFAKSNGLRGFILSYCFDAKAWAYSDATAVGDDGPATMQDFFKKVPKYIGIFAFCILISDRTVLDLLLTSSKIPASLVKRFTYDYDHVEIMNNWLESGKDYKPIAWDTSTKEGAHKMQLYKVVYNKMKSKANISPYNEEIFRQELGMRLVETIEGLNGIEWGKDKFTVSAELVESRQSTAGLTGIYEFPLQNYGFPTDYGFVYTKIIAENNTKTSTMWQVTNYLEAWSSQNTTTVPTSFDFSKVNNSFDGSTVTLDSYTVTAFDENNQRLLVKDTKYSGTKLSWSYEDSTKVKRVSITFKGKYKLKGSNTEKSLNTVIDSPSWVATPTNSNNNGSGQ